MTIAHKGFQPRLEHPGIIILFLFFVFCCLLPCFFSFRLPCSKFALFSFRLKVGLNFILIVGKKMRGTHYGIHNRCWQESRRGDRERDNKKIKAIMKRTPKVYRRRRRRPPAKTPTSATCNYKQITRQNTTSKRSQKRRDHTQLLLTLFGDILRKGFLISLRPAVIPLRAQT